MAERASTCSGTYSESRVTRSVRSQHPDTSPRSTASHRAISPLHGCTKTVAKCNTDYFRPSSFQALACWHEYCSRHSQSSRAARIGMGNCTYRLSTTTGAARKTRPSIRWSSATTRPWCRYASSRAAPCLTSSCKSSRSFCDAVSWPMASPQAGAAIAATTAWSHFHVSAEGFVLADR